MCGLSFIYWRLQLQLVPELQHQFIEASNWNKPAAVVFDYLMYLLCRFVSGAKAPVHAALDWLSFSQKPHKTAVITPIADNDWCVAGENQFERPLPTLGEHLNFAWLVERVKQEIAMNFCNERTA